MYDTERRVALVKQRVRENTRRRQRHEAISLSAACMLLFAALMQTAGTVVGPGQTAAWGSFGAMLLREDAGGYVLVGVVCFAAAVVITALCFRLRNRENQKKGGVFAGCTAHQPLAVAVSRIAWQSCPGRRAFCR